LGTPPSHLFCCDEGVPPIPELVAHKIARELDLDVHDIGVCLACLSFVSFAIDAGDTREIKLWTNRMTPDLWAEGLEQPAKLALKRAGQYEALADVERNGGHSHVARAIVVRLAAQLAERAKGDPRKMGFQRWR
jgi:hypothetical protein